MSQEENEEFVAAHTPQLRGRTLYPEYEASRTTKRSE